MERILIINCSGVSVGLLRVKHHLLALGYLFLEDVRISVASCASLGDAPVGKVTCVDSFGCVPKGANCIFVKVPGRSYPFVDIYRILTEIPVCEAEERISFVVGWSS